MNESAASMHQCLVDFASLCNANPHLSKLIQRWERNIHVRPKDDPAVFTLALEGGSVCQVACEALEGKPSITVSGPPKVLIDVFSGRVNPAEALISMGLEIYGAEEDIMKLDAITLVLWDW